MSIMRVATLDHRFFNWAFIYVHQDLFFSFFYTRDAAYPWAQSWKVIEFVVCVHFHGSECNIFSGRDTSLQSKTILISD